MKREKRRTHINYYKQADLGIVQHLLHMLRALVLRFPSVLQTEFVTDK